MNKFISISLSPNVQKQDIFLASKLLFSPNKINGGAIAEFTNKFKEKVGLESAWTLNSGRSALMLLLRSLSLDSDDEVLLQAFSCNAAVNPILWTPAKPVFVDIDDSYNIDPEDLLRKITAKSKVVIVQHTFGVPARMDEIMKICKEKNLFLIEDCAHSLGAKYKEKTVGTMGDASYFSFGRDKVISCVYGGLLSVKDEKLAKKINEKYEDLEFPSTSWTIQQLLHPILMSFVVKTYASGFGKALLVLFQKIGLLSKAVTKGERIGIKPKYFPYKLPDALARLAITQLSRIDEFNEHRNKIASLYEAFFMSSGFEYTKRNDEVNPNFYRFTLRHKKAHDIIKTCWKNNLLIGDFYTSVLIPNGTDLSIFGYQEGSCPRAQIASQETFNLPTHINIGEVDAKYISDFIKSLN